MLVKNETAEKLESLLVKAIEANEKVLDSLCLDKIGLNKVMTPEQENFELAKLSNICYSIQSLYSVTRRD